MRIVSFAAATLVLAGALGCASSSKQQRSEAPATQQPAAPATPTLTGVCPMQVPGTRVAESDTSTGAALAFTTSSTDPNDLAQLRARVEHLAAIFNNKGGGCPCHRGQGMPQGPGMQGGSAGQGGAGPGCPCGRMGPMGPMGPMGSSDSSGFSQSNQGAAAGEADEPQGGFGDEAQGGIGGSGKGKKGAKPAPPPQPAPPPAPEPTPPSAAPPGPPGALPPSTASYEPIDNGAQIIFTPKDPADAEALRAAVRARAQMMSQPGGCPMMMQPGAPSGIPQPGTQQPEAPPAGSPGSGGSGFDSSLPLEQQSYPIPAE